MHRLLIFVHLSTRIIIHSYTSSTTPTVCYWLSLYSKALYTELRRLWPQIWCTKFQRLHHRLGTLNYGCYAHGFCVLSSTGSATDLVHQIWRLWPRVWHTEHWRLTTVTPYGYMHCKTRSRWLLYVQHALSPTTFTTKNDVIHDYWFSSHITEKHHKIISVMISIFIMYWALQITPRDVLTKVVQINSIHDVWKHLMK